MYCNCLWSCDCKNNRSVHQCRWGCLWLLGFGSLEAALSSCLPWPSRIWLRPCPQHFWDGWVRKVWRRGDGIGEALTEMVCEKEPTPPAWIPKSLFVISDWRESDRAKSLCSLHTHQTGLSELQSFLDHKSPGEVEEVFGEECWSLTVDLICSEVKLCEWFVLSQLIFWLVNHKWHYALVCYMFMGYSLNWGTSLWCYIYMVLLCFGETYQIFVRLFENLKYH